MEKVIAKHLQREYTFRANTYGAIAGRSSTDAIVSLINTAKGKGLIKFRAFDIKTAFNRTNRSEVIRELETGLEVKIGNLSSHLTSYVNRFLKPKPYFEVWWEGKKRG
jgi:hypothetical protein